MKEIKTVEVTHSPHRSLLPEADSVITVDKGRGFIIEHRALFDFGGGVIFAGEIGSESHLGNG